MRIDLALTAECHKVAGVLPAFDLSLSGSRCGFFNSNTWFNALTGPAADPWQINITLAPGGASAALDLYLLNAGIYTHAATATVTTLALAWHSASSVVAWTWLIDSGTGAAFVQFDLDTIPP